MLTCIIRYHIDPTKKGRVQPIRPQLGSGDPALRR